MYFEKSTIAATGQNRGVQSSQGIVHTGALPDSVWTESVILAQLGNQQFELYSRQNTYNEILHQLCLIEQKMMKIQF